jgi:hypothetical protein
MCLPALGVEKHVFVEMAVVLVGSWNRRMTRKSNDDSRLKDDAENCERMSKIDHPRALVAEVEKTASKLQLVHEMV